MRNTMLAIQDADLADKINAGNVDMSTLYTSIEKAASDGLILDKREAALVCFYNKDKKKNDIVYMPMVAGVIKLCRNSGELRSISAHVVYEKDHFKHVKAPTEYIEHSSVALDESPGEKIGAYATATLSTGETVYCVMRKEQIMAVRNIAKTHKIWDGPFGDQMWEKAAIRRLAKRLPASTDMDRLFEHDNDSYDMSRDVTPDDEPVLHGTVEDKIAAALVESWDGIPKKEGELTESIEDEDLI